jgi:hypothetical protein
LNAPSNKEQISYEIFWKKAQHNAKVKKGINDYQNFAQLSQMQLFYLFPTFIKLRWFLQAYEISM